MTSAQRRRLVERTALGLAVLPAAALSARALLGDLGANPVETITHETGEWGLRFLLLTLAVTPLRRLAGLPSLAPLRRIFGLAAFAYACLHLATFVVLEHFFDWDALLEDVLERRYVSAGFAAFLCLVPLALTSTRGMMKRLGRRWTTLHRLAYVAAALAVVHFLWLVKKDLREPLVAAALLAVLLGYRAWVWGSSRTPA